MASTELIVPGDDSPYTVLAMPQAEITDLITSNLSPGESIGVKDLIRVKVPGAGGTTWEVQTIDGPEPRKELTGVIVRRDSGRAYYATPFDGGNEPPDCASHDMVIGVANADSETPGPGGVCAECPFNEFGSGKGGIGKACSEYRRLFVLPRDALLPIMVKIPAGSLANARAYFFGLMNGRLKPGDVETVMTLTKEKSVSGIDYAQVNFRTGLRLDPEAKARIAAYSQLIAPSMDRAAASDDATPLDEDEPAAKAA